MEAFAKAVKLAAKFREESYDKEAANKATHEPKIVDFDKFYKLTLMEAADKAAEIAGLDTRGTFPVYLTLKYCWNDILNWSEQY